MTNNNPLVSIIIPVYNGSNFMRKAINSALAQTYKNIEVIVINDGSTDKGKTDKIARSYGNKIRYIKKSNGGVSSAINYGIKNMRGDFFSWLSHDDIYLPNKIEAEIEYLKKHNLLDKKVIAYSDYQVIDKRGRIITELNINHKLAEQHHNYAFLRGVMNGLSLLIPKSAWKTYGGLDTKLICVQDYEKWFEMSQSYTFVHIPKALVQSRYHAKQVTNTNPKVITEGNEFWIKVVSSLTKKQQIAFSGSQYAYYYYYIQHFKTTPYDKALAYCEDQIKKFPPETNLPKEKLISYKQNIEPFSENPIIKLFQFIDREGVKNTSKRIINKLSSILSK